MSMSEQKQKQLVGSVFDSWNRGETPEVLAIQQLTTIVDKTTYGEVKHLATGSLETVKAQSLSGNH